MILVLFVSAGTHDVLAVECISINGLEEEWRGTIPVAGREGSHCLSAFLLLTAVPAEH